MTHENITTLINQFFDIEKKASNRDLSHFNRNFSRLKATFEEMGFNIINPLNEAYKETRTDITAHISSDKKGELRITEVIKPIIYLEENGQFNLIQKGNVIVG